MFSLIEISF